MAITPGQGISGIAKNKRYEDYQSMKQYFSDRTIQEVKICGNVTTDGAAAEIGFVTGDFINYIGAEGQVYIRAEADDAGQHSKYVYIEYQDDTGAIQTILTADLDGADSTTEVIVTGADDFYRLRQMTSEVESATAGGKMVILTDAAYDGVADGFGYISDNNSEFALERFFTQPEATCDSYLAYVYFKCSSTSAAATDDSYFTDITITPRPTNLGEVAATADITLHMEFENELICSPCILLAGGTEVIFQVGDNASAGQLFMKAVLLEVYPTNSTPSS